MHSVLTRDVVNAAQDRVPATHNADWFGTLYLTDNDKEKY